MRRRGRVGSTTKSIIVDQNGILLGAHSLPHKQYYPQDGFVEHDPLELYANTLRVIREVIDKCDVGPESIRALAITNQRETAIIWDRKTGAPICRAIVWQCMRSKSICEELSKRGYDRLIKNKTGYLLVPSPPAGKIRWALENIDGAKDSAKQGNLLFGTVDTWLLWKLTGGSVHATDYSNASRTTLFNINTLEWDQELLELFQIPKKMMPEVMHSDEVFGYTNAEGIFGQKKPIAGLMGDSHAALFGQACYEKGMLKATYGTGSSIMMNIGEKPLESRDGLVTSIGWAMRDQIVYVYEGNANYTGVAIKWLIEDFGLFSDMCAFEKTSLSVESNGGVYFVPAFAGLGAPYWDNDARAAILGIGMGTRKAHIARAALESIAYQTKDLIDLMLKQGQMKAQELRVDGAPTRNDFLMQFQADLVDAPVVRQRIEDISALGSAYMAGLAVGVWTNREELRGMFREKTRYERKMALSAADELYRGWKNAVRRTLTAGMAEKRR